MQCIKTGFSAYLEHSQEYAYGDAFIIGSLHFDQFGDDPVGCLLCKNHLLLRVCDLKVEGPRIIQLRTYSIDHWFDERQTSGAHNSTLLINPHQWEWLGYRGIECND